jgi:hypothetical protein
MSIVLKRLGTHGVNLFILHGRIDRETLIEFYREIDLEDPDNKMPWITYLASDADLSEVDVETYIELKRILAPLRECLEPDKCYVSIVVSNSERSDGLISFWHDFIARESNRPPYTVLYSDVKDASRGLNLSGNALLAIEEAIRAQREAREPREAPREGSSFSDRP